MVHQAFCGQRCGVYLCSERKSIREGGGTLSNLLLDTFISLNSSDEKTSRILLLAFGIMVAMVCVSVAF